MQVIARVSGRRSWTVGQKLAILRDAFGPGGSVRAAMERHEVSSGLVYTWRRQAMSGELAGTPRSALPAFAEVRVTDDCPAATPAPPYAVAVDPPGRIGIELLSGIKLSVDASVDVDALGRVLSILMP
jgi:transposase